jgi:hypothetical protein
MIWRAAHDGTTARNRKPWIGPHGMGFTGVMSGAKLDQSPQVS